MTDCNDDTVARQIPRLDAGGPPTPDPDASILITHTGVKYGLTARAESDVHTAILQGLASYVAGLQTAIDGRFIALSRVTVDFAEHDDGPAPPPAGAVRSDEVGKYATDSGLAPGRPVRLEPDTAGRLVTLTSSAVYELEEVMVDVWCEDKIQRAGVRRMLEDGFWPVDWMSGFRLVLPRYHNAIAEYLLIGAQQPDDGDQATASLWPLRMKLRARCAVHRVHVLPLARVSVTGTI